MAFYRLQTAKRTRAQTIGSTVLDPRIRAKSDDKAVAKAKNYPLLHFLDEADFVWLTNAQGETIWSLRLKESRVGDRRLETVMPNLVDLLKPRRANLFEQIVGLVQ